MSRLNTTISEIAFVLDNLILLRQILSTGNCNDCKNKNCGYCPEPGRIVRYNCPFYISKESEEEYAESNN